MNTFDMITNGINTTQLTVNESAKITALVNKYGSTFGESAKAIVISNHIESFSTIAKSKAVFEAINGYESKCGDKKKCSEARKAFEEATEMTQPDITRYMSIYASLYIPLLNSDLFDDEKSLELYLSQFEYTKLFELAKLNEKDLLYIVTEYKDLLPTLSKSKLIFALESYKAKVAPTLGRDKDFKMRLDWIESNKKLADYGKPIVHSNGENKPENKPENKSDKPNATPPVAPIADNNKGENKPENKPENKANSAPTTAKELAEIELSFGSNSIGKLADSATWDNLFIQLDKCGIMDIFTVFATNYCKSHNIVSANGIAIPTIALDGNILTDMTSHKTEDIG